MIQSIYIVTSDQLTHIQAIMIRKMIHKSKIKIVKQLKIELKSNNLVNSCQIRNKRLRDKKDIILKMMRFKIMVQKEIT
jgi:hypothetical protein